MSAEVVQQTNLEQGFRTQYLILQSYRRDPAAAGVVRSKQRVAAFLQPTDGPRYFDAAGKPVAFYLSIYLSIYLSPWNYSSQVLVSPPTDYRFIALDLNVNPVAYGRNG